MSLNDTHIAVAVVPLKLNKHMYIDAYKKIESIPKSATLLRRER